jgi:anti-anti-sigma factor
MQIEIATADGRMQVRLTGNFDYTMRNQFMAQMDEAMAQAPVEEVRIEMAAVDYIDSSALGMLLMLRDKAKKQDAKVILANPQGRIRQVLNTAQFERLFTVV